MPFLELAPFTSSPLGTVVFFLSLAMLARDGLFMLLVLTAGPAALFRLALQTCLQAVSSPRRRAFSGNISLHPPLPEG